VTRYGTRLLGVAAIERGLAAAGLGLRKIQVVAQTLEHFGHRDSNLGENLIDNTGHEQGNFHSLVSAVGITLNCAAFCRARMGMELVTVSAVQPREEHYVQLEQGNILFFPRTPFALSEDERDVLRSTGLTSGSLHKNIAYRPASDKVTGFDKAIVRDPGKLREVLRGYSQRVLGVLRRLLPRYMEGHRIDFASFRSQEEEGRELPTKKRNDLLHVDAFPTRPTKGDLILRVFTNINKTKPRVWLTSDPFEPLAKRYAMDAGLPEIAKRPGGPWLGGVLRAVGLPVAERSAYDRFMLSFHDYLKFNEQYQRDCAKYRFEFPPDSTWMVFTDIVPHAVLSGQHALEQTVIVRRESLAARRHAPIDILEALCGQALAPTS
jgi:hypothetical protein